MVKLDKKSLKCSSVWFQAMGALVMAIDIATQTWHSLPDEIQDKMPYGPKIALGLFLLGIVGRVMSLKGGSRGDNET
jgi:hypothetical protein